MKIYLIIKVILNFQILFNFLAHLQILQNVNLYFINFSFKIVPNLIQTILLCALFVIFNLEPLKPLYFHFLILYRYLIFLNFLSLSVLLTPSQYESFNKILYLLSFPNRLHTNKLELLKYISKKLMLYRMETAQIIKVFRQKRFLIICQI